MRLSRYWMTGCMALVLMAAGRGTLQGGRDGPDQERRGRVTVTSHLPVDETIRQLQQAALRLGWPVMAQVTPADQSGRGGPESSQVLVLGHFDGHTPILQAQTSSSLDLPLKLLVSALPDGSSQITYSTAQAWGPQAEVPSDLLRDMAALPQVVQTALALRGPPAQA
jgi:uncharacterized protein (DUF302 family)